MLVRKELRSGSEFSIMHGSLFRRQTVVENRQFGFQSFWPVQSASAIYNCEF